MLRLNHKFAGNNIDGWHTYIKGDRYYFIDATDLAIGQPKYVFNLTGALPDGSFGLLRSFDVYANEVVDIHNFEGMADHIRITHYFYDKTQSMIAVDHAIFLPDIISVGLLNTLYTIIELDKNKC